MLDLCLPSKKPLFCGSDTPVRLNKSNKRRDPSMITPFCVHHCCLYFTFFTPQVYGMFENNDIDPENACLIVNGCHPDDLNGTEPDVGLPSTPALPPVVYTPSKEANLENALKVVFLADIHIDHDYAEVGN